MKEIRLTEELLEAAREAAEEDGCTLSEQIEHWAHIGRVMENNPDITYDAMIEVAESMEVDCEDDCEDD